ncbi:hypothetical protein [Lamprocystis purpurea]|jgi:hypothetical protein|uniref:hypothetical protein n=1 Tax=Lamprocystis purpurea TaxID=61598 RepID=UPI000373D7AE|nr:hypothetical protein [Lamprocystis purpurea]
MQAVKALYRNGNIQLLAPLTGVVEAELLIVVLDRDEGAGLPVAAFQRRPDDAEQDFQALGMASYFATDDDARVDWEEVFDVKPR